MSVCARARACMRPCVCTLKCHRPRASSGSCITQLCVDVDTLSSESVQLGGHAAAQMETLPPPRVPCRMGIRGASGFKLEPAEGENRRSGVITLLPQRLGSRLFPSRPHAQERPRAWGLAGGAPSPGAARTGPWLAETGVNSNKVKGSTYPATSNCFLSGSRHLVHGKF